MNLTRRLIDRVTHNRRLHKLALKAYSIRHPPPYRRPDMEFEFDAWHGISSLHYRGGRQIGEDNTGPYPYKEFTQNQYETCKFADSRNGLPMNMTNLQLVMPYAADAYKLTTVLRNRYLAHRGLAGPGFNLIQAYLFSKFAVSLPAYLTRRVDQPVRDGDLGPLETAFYMLCTAPFMLVRQTMVRGDPTPLEIRPMSGDELYRLADVSRVLISTRERACPATPKLIREFYDVIMNGGYRGPLESAEVDRALERLGDWNRFYSYAHAASRLELLIKLAQALAAQALLALQRSGRMADSPASGLLDTTTEAALQRSYVKTSPTKDAASVLGNILDVLDALLRDHGAESTLAALRAAGCLGDTEELARATPGATAKRLRSANALLHEACGRDLLTVQKALGRTSRLTVSESDLLRRTGGPELSTLIEQIESTASEGAAP